MVSNDIIRAREYAIREALKLIDSNVKLLGIGTGSTMAQLIRIAHESGILRGRYLIASSIDTALRLKSLGYKVLSTLSVSGIDLYIDSADEVDSSGRMIKGGGGALFNEKLLATYSRRAVFVVDYKKFVKRLGLTRPIPIEVAPAALSLVTSKLRSLGFKVSVREGTGKKGPVISDSLGVLVDVYLPNKDVDLMDFNRLIKGVVGVIETGLFLDEASEVFVGYPDGKVLILKGPRSGKA